MLKPPTFDHIGPGFLENAPDACAADLADEHRRHPAIPRACTAQPLEPGGLERGAGWNMVVPPEVRGALICP